MVEYGLSKTLSFTRDRKPSRNQEVFCLHLERVLGFEREPVRGGEFCHSRLSRIHQSLILALF